MTVSVLLPTMNRPKLLIAELEQLYKTTEGHNLEVICVIDEDEESLAQVQAKFSQVRTRFNPTRVGAIAAWNQALEMSMGDMLFPLGDDQWPHDNWLDIALTAHRDKLGGYGAVGLNDLVHDGNVLATTLIYDRRFCVEQFGGVVCPPIYRYYACDNELNARAKRAGKFVWCPDAVVEHLHPCKNKRPVDESDLIRMPFFEADVQLFRERESQGFPNNWEPVITS